MKTLPEVLAVFKKDGIELSDQQAAVVNWVITGKGSLQLIARAGCGKTFTLIKVIQTIISCNLGDVVGMAYNKAIATELKGKLEALGIIWKQAEANTVHAFGFRAWKKIAPNVILLEKKDEKLWKIIDICKLDEGGSIFESQSEAIVKLTALAKQQAFGHLTSIDNVQAWHDLYEHYDIENVVTDNTDPTDIIKAAIKVYKISLKQCYDFIDFDDMILAPLYFKARFWPKKWVLVDESQDTNPARRALALAMLDPRGGRMIFCGDDRQAIYGFSGANSDAMDQLKTATNASTLTLNVTRRCPKVVVKRAQKLVSDFTAHKDAPEGIERSIAYENLEKENLKSGDAILCRNTAPLIRTAYSLIAKGVGCKVEGRKIGYGLVALAKKWKVVQLVALQNKLDDYFAKQSAKWMSKGQEDKIDRLGDQIECLKVVISRCQLNNRHTINELVEDINSMFGDTAEDKQATTVILSTIHKSKGREWERVYLLGNPQFLPSPYARKPWQLIQESNLEYVSISRSMRELIDVPMPEDKSTGK